MSKEPEITASAKDIILDKKLDPKLITPNADGKITKREVDAYLANNADKSPSDEPKDETPAETPLETETPAPAAPPADPEPEIEPETESDEVPVKFKNVLVLTADIKDGQKKGEVWKGKDEKETKLLLSSGVLKRA